MSILSGIFDKWNSLAKCHAVKMDAGTFFRPHGDAYKTTQQMRIFIPLNKLNCTSGHTYMINN